MTNSIGIIETRSVALAGEALNQILKIKEIELLNIEFPGEGFVTAFLFGEYSKMKDALETANNLSASFSTYFSKKIITKPDEKLFELIKIRKKRILRSKQESEKETEVKKKSAITVDVAPAEIIEKKTEEVKEEKKVKIKSSGKRIGLAKKVKKEKIKAPRQLSSKALKTRNNNPTIARLKKEALGGKVTEQKENNFTIERKSLNQQTDMTLAELEQLNVHKLRHYARSFSGFPIKGRGISKANREELLNHFKELI